MNKNKRILLIILGIFVLTLGVISLKEDEKRFEISKGLNIFASLFRDVNLFYVDDVEPEKLIQTGIDAMLKSLDPYTVYYPESKMDEFKMMTTGAYAGIGSVISMKEDYVVIREPYKGSPADRAGLQPGDLILEVDGVAMKGKNTEFVSQHLKGQPGKEVVLKIKRLGVKNPMSIKVIRENVQLPSVPYYSMLNDKIGYIYFTSFTDKSADDMRQAILDLKKQGAESLVLDIRSNGGGLLDQAVEIANFFLPRNALVVNTKGKIKQWDQEYRTTNNPIVPDMKLAVLIDRASASASEILSGSLQDYDRAVVIGERSFGKGLVQTTRDLVYNTKLKVTTAKYYIPSGRCIQALDYMHRNPDESVGTVPDSLITAFKTKAGRTVYDGGGITPDVKIDPWKYAKITQELVMKDMIFDFVNEYAVTHPAIASPETFEVTDDIYTDFKNYLIKHQFEYETASQAILDKLIETAKAEKYYDQVEGQINQLKSELGHSIDRDLDLFRDEISDILADQMMVRYYMQQGEIIYRMRNDKNIEKAMEILSNEEEYQKILN